MGKERRRGSYVRGCRS